MSWARSDGRSNAASAAAIVPSASGYANGSERNIAVNIAGGPETANAATPSDSEVPAPSRRAIQ
jgi:hypothetical protein